MNLAFDFGITNTDIVCSDDGRMDYFSFPSESVTEESLKKILNSLKLDISKINKIAVTGGKSSDLSDSLLNIPVIKVNEVDAIGYGAKELYKITDSEFLAVSTGTGTACIGLINNEFKHLGGISVGGGTLQGLSNLLFNEVDSEIINKLAIEGNRSELDALIGEVVNNIGSLHPNVTASNFAKARISNNFSDEDLASSLANMVGEVIGTISYLNAMLIGVNKAYYVGRVSQLEGVKKGLDARLKLANIDGQYNDRQGFGNAIGAIAYLDANT